MRNRFSASIVLFNTDLVELTRTIDSIFNEKSDIKLFLIDNSLINKSEDFDHNSQIEYIHNPSNPGFGEAHNIAIKKAIKSGMHYHFVVNPDIYFEGNVILKMIDHIQSDKSIGMMMPQILNKDGSVQNLPKLLPTPFSILWRKIKKPTQAYQKFINRYELRNIPEKQIYNAPVISGCFTLLNLEAIKKVGMYDGEFFMYFEDWDLSRRIHKYYKTIYFPLVSVYHGYESGANKSSRLFKIFVNSAITYFNKWGWFFDIERKKINAKALQQFK